MNQPTSENKNDGLKLYNTYVTTALKCVPPGDKPTLLELRTCFNHFKQEIDLLRNVKIVLGIIVVICVIIYVADSLDEARRDDVRIWGETCPHYLILDEDFYLREDAPLFVMSPPLRHKANQAGLWKALLD